MIFQAGLIVSAMLFSLQTSVNSRAIDEIIMAAAHDVAMFDLVHIMADGDVMIMVELDMLMSMAEFAQYSERSNRGKRKAVANDRLLWKDRIVPYEFARSDFTARNKRTIRSAINEWQNYTCLTFREATNERAKIRFRNGDGCYSRLGRSGGTQPIALASGCRTKGIVVHEIGHAIGWIHEQARPDRDDFIMVNFNQIPPNWRSQFAKAPAALINDRGVEYDYDSVMHYSGNVFGSRTIVTKDPKFQNRIGQRQGLSFRDIKLANLMYQCAESKGCMPRQCPGEGFQGKDCNCYCPGTLVVLCKEQTVSTTPSTTAASTTPTTTTTTTLPAEGCMPRQCPGEGFQRKDCNCYCPGTPVVLCKEQTVSTTPDICPMADPCSSSVSRASFLLIGVLMIFA
ncbi:nematocyst expressed protein 6-like [Gigantopelta aegis]|uniref:nematocyst expressed protein 6-like n=1 Tax=Gigantopelta aegis TaxID=1735272 RepID=UPI001B88E453|nr:nematocyst expressed protein 6-like [Gigantopelta aegis]